MVVASASFELDYTQTSTKLSKLNQSHPGFESDYTQTSTKLSKLNQSHPGFESGFLDLDH